MPNPINSLSVGTSFTAITPSDSETFDPPYRAIMIGGAGDLAVLGVDDTAAVTIKNLKEGSTFTGAVKKVMATNTTANLLIGIR